MTRKSGRNAEYEFVPSSVRPRKPAAALFCLFLCLVAISGCGDEKAGSEIAADSSTTTARESDSGSSPESSATGSAADVDVSDETMQAFCDSDALRGSTNTPNDNGNSTVESNLAFIPQLAGQVPDLLSGDSVSASVLFEGYLRARRDAGSPNQSIPESITDDDINAIANSDYIVYYRIETGDTSSIEEFVPTSAETVVPLTDPSNYAEREGQIRLRVEAKCTDFIEGS